MSKLAREILSQNNIDIQKKLVQQFNIPQWS